ncbi:hypothetical protein MF406_09700 [Georgenia sp. TF02-10]|uniref:hypothetical protein n=1 Tax=unclassified Georgenia TaxID=2626815 RepID=UPI001FA7D25D|nr:MULTISPECIES: hypothetical protein [unclassified Georgenia]UNX53295.1 hypothetical protein MF406_09700 [Georgenia sp. TF02-10]
MKSNVVATHADATRLDIHDLVRILNENVGTSVVQAMTGTKDRGQPARWPAPTAPSRV